MANKDFAAGLAALREQLRRKISGGAGSDTGFC